MCMCMSENLVVVACRRLLSSSTDGKIHIIPIQLIHFWGSYDRNAHLGMTSCLIAVVPREFTVGALWLIFRTMCHREQQFLALTSGEGQVFCDGP